jgi:protein gp37
MATAIEWTDETWNPLSGCTKVSPGCDNCYAERITTRWGRDFSKVEMHTKRLEQPSKWKRPRMIFVNSMSDTFHSSLTNHQIDVMFYAMFAAPQHTYQVLTKRPNRVKRWWARLARAGYEWPRNIWLGTSVESATYLPRIDRLTETPAPIKFVSIEPLLGRIPYERLEVFLHFRQLQWVIVGGESGPSARPMHPDWAREVRDACVDYRVPFFFKQWGEWTPGENVESDRKYPTQSYFDGKWSPCTDDWVEEADYGPIMYRLGKKAAGRMLDGREWSEMPQMAAEGQLAMLPAPAAETPA